MMTHAAALALLAERAPVLARQESVPLASSIGRVLAERIVASHDVPAQDNAAVDGYAFRAADGAHGDDTGLTVAGVAAAGRPFDGGTVPARSAIRILTGAIVPPGLDTVAMQEDCRLEQTGATTRVVVPAGLRRGRNIRRAGEDVTAGSTLIEAGQILRPQEIAQLASIGRSSAICTARPKVAVVSTGDEVVEPGGGALTPGKVYDANRLMLAPMIVAAGGEVTDLGIWRDDRADTTRRLADAAATFDLVLTSGGASTGDEDHMAAALAALGQRHLWRLAIKPGRPMMLGRIGTCSVVGLPGNPVAAFVCFLMYVRPLIARLSGRAWPEPRQFPLPARFAIDDKKVGRREFLRGILVDGPGGLAVDRYPRDGSGLISGLRAADGLIDIPEDVHAIAVGDPVAFIPFSELGIG
jgi:molybdopterin molybdotransferase